MQVRRYRWRSADSYRGGDREVRLEGECSEVLGRRLLSCARGSNAIDRSAPYEGSGGDTIAIRGFGIIRAAKAGQIVLDLIANGLR